MEKQMVSLTVEDLQAILRQQQENFIAAVVELKKLDPATERKMKKEAEAADKAFHHRMEVLIAEEEGKKRRQTNCPHRMDNGNSPRSAIHRGQLFSDGKFHPICGECSKEFEPITPSMSELAGATV